MLLVVLAVIACFGSSAWAGREALPVDQGLLLSDDPPVATAAIEADGPDAGSAAGGAAPDEEGGIGSSEDELPEDANAEPSEMREGPAREHPADRAADVEPARQVDDDDESSSGASDHESEEDEDAAADLDESPDDNGAADEVEVEDDQPVGSGEPSSGGRSGSLADETDPETTAESPMPAPVSTSGSESAGNASGPGGSPAGKAPSSGGMVLEVPPVPVVEAAKAVVPVASAALGRLAPVLARWQLFDNICHYPAFVLASAGHKIEVVFPDGARRWVPWAAVIARPIAADDLLFVRGRPGRLASAGRRLARIRWLDGGGEADVEWPQVGVLLRLDHHLGETVAPAADGTVDAGTSPGGAVSPPAWRPAAGERVWARWPDNYWYLGTAVRVEGEGVEVQFLDQSAKWAPLDQVRPGTVATGAVVMAPNPDELQLFPARVADVRAGGAGLRFFDDTPLVAPLASLATPLDQPWFEPMAACRCGQAGAHGRSAEIAAGWLAPRIAFYAMEDVIPRRTGVAADDLEVVVAAFFPADRKPPTGWQPAIRRVAGEIERVLRRDLQGAALVQVSAWPDPIVATATMAWMQANLREDQPWNQWLPTAMARQAIFPERSKPGRFRILVVIPDLPGLSMDDAGTEAGIGFVRQDGRWLSHLAASVGQPAPADPSARSGGNGWRQEVASEAMALPAEMPVDGRSGHRSGMDQPAGVAADGLPPPGRSFRDWAPLDLATTICHEIHHTLGLMHTDGDPYEILNYGPWYGPDHPGVHLSRRNLYLLRTPFRDCAALAQGFASWLDEGTDRLLAALARFRHGPADLRLHYAEGPGWPRLRPLLAAFERGGRCRSGVRERGGERRLAQTAMGALIAFLIERDGVGSLPRLFTVGGRDPLVALAGRLRLPPDRLEVEWHRWLTDRCPGADPAGASPR